jgi:hypothetical protein
MNQQKIVAVIVGLISIFIIGFVLFINRDEAAAPATIVPEVSNDTERESISDENLATYTAAEVADRNTANECWTIIDGNVYDITSYIPRHPGGDTILEACGLDGSNLFNQRRSEDGSVVGSGTPHSSGARSSLEAYRIGILSQ